MNKKGRAHFLQLSLPLRFGKLFPRVVFLRLTGGLLLLFVLVSLTAFSSSAEKKTNDRRYRVAWWNVENLFDTLHDVGHDDQEFLPTSERAWGSRRYWAKQGALARTILAMGGVQPVDLIGLCEVENDSVLYDLTHRTRLARLGYAYVATQGIDVRGIEVALLYQPDRFRLLQHQCIRIAHDSLQERPTRDLLHCSGLVPRGDTLDVVLAHLPSRRGGIARTEGYRLHCARRIAQLIDSLSSVRDRLLCICMGDFNDEATDCSIREGLGARLRSMSHHALALHAPQDARVEGSYYFQGQWSRIDQILLSPALLLPDSPLRTQPEGCHIYAWPFLLEKSGAGGYRPRRTYLGTHYHGGVSDHLPLFQDFWY